MKILNYIAGVLLLFMVSSTVHGQISVNVNLGAPPMWGPVGYTDTRYYYLPDVEAYYDVPSSNFIYFERGQWVHRKYLPRQYRSYDLYHGYKVVMTDYRGNAPYEHFRDYKVKYAKGYKGKEQKTIGIRPAQGHSDARSYKSNNQSKGKSGSSGGGKDKSHGKSNGGGKGKK